MKHIKQFGIILVVSFVGEALHSVIPLPIPASIYGLVLMFFCLSVKLIPCKAVKETGTFLIEIMPLMFIPAAVGLMKSWGLIRPLLIPYMVITVVTTFLVMIVSGRVTQAAIRRSGKKTDDE